MSVPLNLPGFVALQAVMLSQPARPLCHWSLSLVTGQATYDPFHVLQSPAWLRHGVILSMEGGSP